MVLHTQVCISKNTYEDLKNDKLPAKIKKEFDEQYEELYSDQRNFNKGSQGCIRKLEDYGDYIDTYDSEEWYKFDMIERQLFPMCSRGYKSEIKHSVVLNKSKNGYKLLTFPPAFQGIHKVRCKNFKNFDVSSKYEQKKSYKKENHSIEPIPTYCKSKMDSYGCFVIRRYIYNQLLKRVNDVINIGRSSNVFHADSNQSYPKIDLPKKCAIKMFKDVSVGGRYEYETSKESLQLWGQREMMGLKKLEGIINCPQLVCHKQHVVVMAFVGKLYQPAPKLKDVTFEAKEYIILYNEIKEAMKAMYKKGNLIHSDLSADKILWHNGKCYFINFKQCLELHEENAYDMLYEDCKNIISFFNEKNTPYVLTADGLFQYITGCSYMDKFALMRMIEAEQKKHLDKIRKLNM